MVKQLIEVLMSVPLSSSETNALDRPDIAVKKITTQNKSTG